eukprot:jgi/Ulvmu1/7878/UM004_0109.1
MSPSHKRLYHMQVCEAISGSKSSAYTMKALVPLVSPLMVISTMQPMTFTKYITFMRSALSRCEEQAISNPQHSTHSSSNGATTWDEPAHSSAAPARSVPGSDLYSPAGLGLGKGDALSDWSSSVVVPASEMPAVAQYKSADNVMNGNRSMFPSANSAQPPVQSNRDIGDIFMGAASTTHAAAGFAHGRAIGGGLSMAAAMGKPFASPPKAAAAPLFPDATDTTGSTAPQMNGVTAHFSGMSVAGPSGDPFADLLGGPITGMAAAGQKQPNSVVTNSLLDARQPGQWDPFA